MLSFVRCFCQAMRRGHTMRYLHTMLRVRNLDQALDFYCNKLGLKEVRRRVDDKNRYTLVFLAARRTRAGPRKASAAAATLPWSSSPTIRTARTTARPAISVTSP